MFVRVLSSQRLAGEVEIGRGHALPVAVIAAVIANAFCNAKQSFAQSVPFSYKRGDVLARPLEILLQLGCRSRLCLLESFVSHADLA